MQKKRFT